MWDVVTACQSQLRVAGIGGPYGLDFGAVMMVGAARGADLGLLADVLPACESAILIGRGNDDFETEE